MQNSNIISLFLQENLDENINTIKTIKTIETIETNGLVRHKPNITRETPATQSLEATPSFSGEDQKAFREGSANSPKRTLAKEKEALIADSEWISQTDVSYAKISVWLHLNKTSNLFSEYKCQYGLKLPNTDLRKSQFKSKLTYRHNDYIGYAREKWADADTWHYPELAKIVKTQWDSGSAAFVGRCAANMGAKKSKHRTPNIPFTSILIHYDAPEDEWQCHLWHHGFHKTMSVPQWEWNARKADWIKNYGIAKEFSKKVPPFITFEWRNLA